MGCSGEHYAEALSVAVQSKRAVRFIRWGMEIPIVSFEDLIKANLMTFLTTGRYVTTYSVWHMIHDMKYRT